MRRTKHIEGQCQLCHGRLEFPVETIGLSFPCPHCGQPTELKLAMPPEEPTLPRRAIIWALVAAFILGLGLAGSMIALNQAEKWALQRKQAERVAPSAVPTNVPP
jgi:hypothetical protein